VPSQDASTGVENGEVKLSPQPIEGLGSVVGSLTGPKRISVLLLSKRHRMPLVEMFVVNCRPVRRHFNENNYSI